MDIPRERKFLSMTLTKRRNARARVGDDFGAEDCHTIDIDVGRVLPVLDTNEFEGQSPRSETSRSLLWIDGAMERLISQMQIQKRFERSWRIDQMVKRRFGTFEYESLWRNGDQSVQSARAEKPKRFAFGTLLPVGRSRATLPKSRSNRNNNYIIKISIIEKCCPSPKCWTHIVACFRNTTSALTPVIQLKAKASAILVAAEEEKTRKVSLSLEAMMGHGLRLVQLDRPRARNLKGI